MSLVDFQPPKHQFNIKSKKVKMNLLFYRLQQKIVIVMNAQGGQVQCAQGTSKGPSLGGMPLYQDRQEERKTEVLSVQSDCLGWTVITAQVWLLCKR